MNNTSITYLEYYSTKISFAVNYDVKETTNSTFCASHDVTIPLNGRALRARNLKRLPTGSSAELAPYIPAVVPHLVHTHTAMLVENEVTNVFFFCAFSFLTGPYWDKILYYMLSSFNTGRESSDGLDRYFLNFKFGSKCSSPHHDLQTINILLTVHAIHSVNRINCFPHMKVTV